jgi:hypothetical protein
MRLPLRPLLALPLLAMALGCEAETKAKKAAVQPRETLNKTTQMVLDLKPELEKGGVVSDGKIHSNDYLGVNAEAYRTSVAKIGGFAVEQKMAMYEIEHNEKPKTYQEFMDNIIQPGKPDGIQLPMLPYYQEYGYDSDAKKLVVIEYPARKKEVEEQQDRELGRK